MNLTPVSYSKFNSQKYNFGNIAQTDYIPKHDMQDTYIAGRKSTLNKLVKYLNSINIKAVATKDGYLEISKLDKSPEAKMGDYFAIPTAADYILQYTKKINGSVDFGKIGATQLGTVEELEGNFFGGNKFDFSNSPINDLGVLRKIDGNMIINPIQLREMDFDGLEVTDNIYIRETNKGSKLCKKLSEADKLALLCGFEILRY